MKTSDHYGFVLLEGQNSALRQGKPLKKECLDLLSETAFKWES